MMAYQNKTGLFGKLPAHGDFIYRDLPARFINVWDQWLQGYIGTSREKLGDQWLDVYMTSPIWRFALSEGAVDENAWAGIVLPSVDRVGRYFPFSIATRLAPQVNPTEFLSLRTNWYKAIEDAALRALDGSLHIDDLVEELNDVNPMGKVAHKRGAPLSHQNNMMVRTAGAEHVAQSVLPFMLDACLANSLSSYSIWSTAGSELIDPCVFVSKGLPALSGVSAMLSGQWQASNWQEPFVLV